MRRLLPALLALASIACVHEGGPERPIVVGTTVVAVSFSTTPEELPFNPRGARLVAAGQQLERSLGHPFQIQLDAALVPQWRANFENALSASLEVVARNLAWLARTHPRVDAFARPRLARIVCRYDSAARYLSSDFDPATGALTVDTPVPRVAAASTQPNAPEGAILPEGVLTFALPTAYFRDLERRYDDTAPEEVPPGELDAYWDYLERYQTGMYHRPVPPVRPALADDPEAVLIERTVRFAARVPPDAPLAAEVARRLARWARWFMLAYTQRPDDVASAPPGSAFHHAEAAYSGWLARRMGHLPPAEQHAILRDALFAHRSDGRYVAAFPGFDAFGYALGVLDAWRAAGHPSSHKAAGDDPLLRDIVCPAARDELQRLRVVEGCESHFYGWALAQPEARRRLLEAIVTRRDAALTETVALNVAYLDTHEVIELWRSLEDRPVEWDIVARVIAAVEMQGAGAGAGPAALYDEGLRLWRAHPDRRGAVLYVLRALEPYNMIRDSLVNWTEFDRVFGARIGAAEYAAYVRMGPYAIGRLAGLWKALGDGYSRAEPLIPVLDAYLDDTSLKAYDTRAPTGPLDDVLSRLCADHAEADLALLHAYFQRRTANRPSEERRMGMFLDLTAPGRCAAAKRPGGVRHPPGYDESGF
jgi:hypothetical protein